MRTRTYLTGQNRLRKQKAQLWRKRFGSGLMTSGGKMEAPATRAGEWQESMKLIRLAEVRFQGADGQQPNASPDRQKMTPPTAETSSN